VCLRACRFDSGLRYTADKQHIESHLTASDGFFYASGALKVLQFIRMNTSLTILPSEESNTPIPDDLLLIQGLHTLDFDGPLNPVGIYFLIKDHQVVYVGQSVSAIARIITHINEDRKEFGGAFFLPVPKHLLGLVEQSFIKSIRPLYNVRPGPIRSENVKLIKELNFRQISPSETVEKFFK
jgi:hypothetical protein